MVGGIGLLGDWPQALEDGVDDRLLVDRHVQRLAHFGLVEGSLQRVVGEVADVQAFLLGDR